MKLTVCAVLAALLMWNGLLTWSVVTCLHDNEAMQLQMMQQSVATSYLRHSVAVEHKGLKHTWDREQELEHIVATLIKALQDAETVPAPSGYNKGE